ncbi:hypothetical protein PROFUN_00002 [Planoprotostelium fungivorum]|uniref:Uncharacterized protein n=1 Tax=Planoprotostelium fungivorum TaxID=1890364 RepID=A0A2P6P0E1_9EUKA|nr:hypothetical protein PROFUN_00002 [Planoprotostelium fungivorum]
MKDKCGNDMVTSEWRFGHVAIPIKFVSQDFSSSLIRFCTLQSVTKPIPDVKHRQKDYEVIQ